jgi:hypothetical protein
MAAPGVPEENDTFLEIFGTPTLLWRVLEQAYGATSLCVDSGVHRGFELVPCAAGYSGLHPGTILAGMES